MTNSIFPSFQGFSYEMSRKPDWRNTIYEADSGKETIKEHWSYPKYEIKLNFNFMTDNAYVGHLAKGEIENLQAFINSLRGIADTFLYLDPVENTVVDQTFGLGTGSKTKFQLIRSMATYNEPIKGIIATPTIKIDNIATSAFTFDNYGLVTFNSAPANGAVLKWSGQYYFRVRFAELPELPRTWSGLYENIQISLITVK
jgi:uncharacterized protein (TIGR02217 family)